MKIEEFVDKFWEDLNGRITQVEEGNELVMFFQCDDWDDTDKIRTFKFRCNGVVESTAIQSPSDSVRFLSQHPLIWDHNEPSGQLFYVSEPENRYEILGRMFDAHQKIYGGWRGFNDYANTYSPGFNVHFGEGSNGLLASGPKSLLEAYAKSVRGRVETQLLMDNSRKADYKALIFDMCFVICESVKVKEMSS